MNSSAAPPDRYRRRREAGVASRTETRRRLLTAADDLFRQQGYASTTVSAIAARAAVSVPTLYMVWGSKRDLLRAAAAAAAAADPAVEADRWGVALADQLAHQAATESSAGDYLAALSRLFVRVVSRTARYRELYREAAATDTEIAADWQAVVAESRRTMHAVADAMPRQGLRPDLTDREIGDTVWVLASQDVYDLMTLHGGYTPEAFQQWLHQTLTAALCNDEERSGRPPRSDDRHHR